MQVAGLQQSDLTFFLPRCKIYNFYFCRRRNVSQFICLQKVYAIHFGKFVIIFHSFKLFFPFRSYRQGDVHISFLSPSLWYVHPILLSLFSLIQVGQPQAFFSSGLYVACIRFQLLSSPLLSPLLQKISSKMLT